MGLEREGLAAVVSVVVVVVAGQGTVSSATETPSSERWNTTGWAMPTIGVR